QLLKLFQAALALQQVLPVAAPAGLVASGQQTVQLLLLFCQTGLRLLHGRLGGPQLLFGLLAALGMSLQARLEGLATAVQLGLIGAQPGAFGEAQLPAAQLAGQQGVAGGFLQALFQGDAAFFQRGQGGMRLAALLLAGPVAGPQGLAPGLFLGSLLGLQTLQGGFAGGQGLFGLQTGLVEWAQLFGRLAGGQALQIGGGLLQLSARGLLAQLGGLQLRLGLVALLQPALLGMQAGLFLAQGLFLLGQARGFGLEFRAGLVA